MENILETNLRERLILGGLKELEEHGIKNFSLRRVATLAEVSCAAPYRHFKNKEDLITAIVDYIKNDWLLLSQQISSIFAIDLPNLIKELSSANVKFWMANGNFLSVLFLIQSSTDPNQKKYLAEFDLPLIDAIKNYAFNKNFSEEKLSNLQVAIPSLIYGAIMLITRGSSTSENLIAQMKSTIDSLLS